MRTESSSTPSSDPRARPLVPGARLCLFCGVAAVLWFPGVFVGLLFLDLGWLGWSKLGLFPLSMAAGVICGIFAIRRYVLAMRNAAGFPGEYRGRWMCVTGFTLGLLPVAAIIILPIVGRYL